MRHGKMFGLWFLIFVLTERPQKHYFEIKINKNKASFGTSTLKGVDDDWNKEEEIKKALNQESFFAVI